MLCYKSAVFLSFFSVLLGGCTSLEVRNYFPPVGSEVILKQELISRSGTRVFIQNGRVLERRNVAAGTPNCKFILRRPRGETGEFVIQPGTFTVTRTFREIQRGTVNADMITFMELSSESQPAVSQLACQRWGDPRMDGFVTIDKMKATLSPIVELNTGLE